MASLILSCQNNLSKTHSQYSPNKLSTPFSSKLRFYNLNSQTRKIAGLKCSRAPQEAEAGAGAGLPDKKKPLYSHSLPCIESWLKTLHFYQSNDDRSLWFVHHPLWHAQLSLDITDLYIRYLKSGPGTLEKDVERRFSYALSREDIENAILGGP